MANGPDEPQITDWHEELLVDLLNRRPGHSVFDHREWFDDANPEPYLELADMGLVEGIRYFVLEDGRTDLDADADVRLTEEGRRLAEAARRKLAIEPKRVFVSYVHD